MDRPPALTPIADHSAPSVLPFRGSQRHCNGELAPGDFRLAAYPSILLHILSSCNLNSRDLAMLEATCSFFKQPANFLPDFQLSISELAAFDMCRKRAIFKPMTMEAQKHLKIRCGGSWKQVLRFLMAGEACSRRETSQAIAGPGHSIAVSSKGIAYAFGSNDLGQLGHGTIDEEWQPRPIRSLQGIRIINATAAAGRTMLVSDGGKVYATGDCFVEAGNELGRPKMASAPVLVDALKNIFVVQAAIGNFFTAVLSREGRVYTFCWGEEARLGHQTDQADTEPRPLLGPLENIPVVQIAAGHCFLLALAFQPGGTSVYSVGCGLGGKLGHGSRNDEKQPRLIEHLVALKLRPVGVAAGPLHAAVVGHDGRVCTWGWGIHGCLGHGNEKCESRPKVIESLSHVKATHIATGNYTTFVVADNGNIYSFGCGESANLGHHNPDDAQDNIYSNVLRPKLVESLKGGTDRVVQISLTNSVSHDSHTLALTESGKLYAFGAGGEGQLGVKLESSQTERGRPALVDIDLS